MGEYSSDIAFTPAVKAIQSRNGSRKAYAGMERGRGWQTKVTPDLAVFLARLDMFYLGTSNRNCQPYIQYRGGSPVFLKVIDDHTLGFTDFGGNNPRHNACQLTTIMSRIISLLRSETCLKTQKSSYS